MSYKIQIKSFLNSDIPVLDVGELGLCTDTKELFIGTKDGNLKIASNEDIGELLNLTTSNKSNLVNAKNELNASSDNNVSPKVLDDLNDVDTSTVSPNNGNVLLFKDGLWKPSSTFSGSYVLELDRWNVKNDGTNAENTTKGINNALIWAAQNGFPEVILPKGTYLIDETNTIEPQSFMTLNLNGSILRIRDNGLTHYAVISFKNNQKFSRITNGKIEGDKDTHNYSSGGTHEGGYGIQIGSFTPPSEGGNNTRFISIDNLEILNCTGDAITVNSTFGQIFPTPTMIASSWEQGSINPTDGTLIDNPSKIRSSLKIDMNQSPIKKYGYFGLYGNGYGNLGSDITSEYYDVFFYRSDDTLLSLIKNVQFFDEVEVPNGSNYAKVVLHQSSIPESNNSLINIRVPSFPQHTYIEKCDLHHCRRQGISLCGTKHIYIRDNRIHHIGGIPPQAGIDVEDGYDLNQFIYIERNNFHDNQFYGVVVVNGKAIFIMENKITNTLGEGASLAINAGADEVLISNNIFKKAIVILSGNVTFSYNNLYGTQVSVLGKYYNRPINLYNNLFHNCKLVVNNPFAFLVKIDSCRFFNDLDKIYAFPKLSWTIELMNEPQIISNCSFEGQDFYYLTYSRVSTFKGGWFFENTTFNNVKNPSLFAGTYVNCIFKDVDFLGVISSNEDELNLINCKFTSQDIHNTFLSVNNLKSFIMKNCYIEKPNGTIVKTQKISGEIIIKDTTLKITNDILPRPIILLESTFTGKLIVIDNNILSATNIPQIGILNTTNNSEVIIRNNILKKTNINYNGKDSMQDNIINGIIDPYYKMSSPPTSGFYPLGQKLQNSHPMAGDFIGWICTKAGIANNNTWQANTSYSKNNMVHSNNKVYRSIIGGTSGETAPSHSTGTATDGGVPWEYIDERAKFNQYGAIQA